MHGVNAEGIQKMLERYVNYTVTDVLNAQLPDFNKRNTSTPKKQPMTQDIQVKLYITTSHLNSRSDYKN